MQRLSELLASLGANPTQIARNAVARAGKRRRKTAGASLSRVRAGSGKPYSQLAARRDQMLRDLEAWLKRPPSTRPLAKHPDA